MHVLLLQHIVLVSTFLMNPLSCSNMEKWLRYSRLNLASLFSHSSQIWHNNLAQGRWPALSCQVIVPCLALVADMMLYTIQELSFRRFQWCYSCDTIQCYKRSIGIVVLLIGEASQLRIASNCFCDCSYSQCIMTTWQLYMVWNK